MKIVKHMPITHDILDHDIIGPAFRDGERTILVAQLNKRFGSIPPLVEEHLSKLSAGELRDLSLRIFDARTIDDLFTH